MFDAFDTQITEPARRAAGLAAQAARLVKGLHRAAQDADVRTLRQRAAEAVARAEQAAEAARELHQAVDGLDLAAQLAGGEAAATGAEAGKPAYAGAFENACAAEEIPIEGAWPDYRVFPFDVHVRLAEERAVVGRRSVTALRPEVLARTVRRERERVFGGSFAAERFGRSLVAAYDVLEPGGERAVPLSRVLELLRLGNFGRSRYTADQFAFDLYRYRQTEMTFRGRRVVLTDVRGGGAGYQVPTQRGGHERLTGLRVVPLDGTDGG